MGKIVQFNYSPKSNHVPLLRTKRHHLGHYEIDVGGKTKKQICLHTDLRILILEGCAMVSVKGITHRILEKNTYDIEPGVDYQIFNFGKIPLKLLVLHTGIPEAENFLN